MNYKTHGRRFFILTAFALAGVAPGTIPARAEIIEQILVKINGEIFTKTDLETRQVARLRELQGQKVDLKSDNNEELRKLLDDMTPDILVDAVDEMLVVQRGKELGYTLGDTQFQGVLESIRKQNKLESEEQFQAALKQEGLTIADLRKNLERTMVFQRVQQNEVVNKVALTEEEGRAYYDSHLTEFTTPSSITLREVLTSPPTDSKGINVAADEAAKTRADAIRARAISVKPSRSSPPTFPTPPRAPTEV
jgi:peptidyl-prolyl cis-trans isomerase SurA